MKVFFGTALVIGWLPVIAFVDKETYWQAELIFACVFIVLYSIFLIDIWFNTYYWFSEGKLFWRAGHIIGGHIEVRNIRYLKKHKSPFMFVNGTHKPVLAFNPMVIRYNAYDEVPVSPLEEKEFLETLLKENPDIKVKEA